MARFHFACCRVALERASIIDRRSSAQGEDAGGFAALDLKRLGRTHRQLIVDRGESTPDVLFKVKGTPTRNNSNCTGRNSKAASNISGREMATRMQMLGVSGGQHVFGNGACMISDLLVIRLITRRSPIMHTRAGGLLYRIC